LAGEIYGPLLESGIVGAIVPVAYRWVDAKFAVKAGAMSIDRLGF
jgi:hypothetical protein